MDVARIEELISTKQVTEQDAQEVYEFFKEKVNNYECDDLLDLMVRFQQVEEEVLAFTTRKDVVFLNMTIVKAFMNASLPWRAKKYAIKSGTEIYHICNEEDFEKDIERVKRISGLLVDLASFFNSVLMFGNAANCYHASCELLFMSNAPLRDCAWAKRKEFVARKMQNKDYDYPLDEDIEKKYGEYAKGIIDAKNGKGFVKRDPVESSDAFQKVYDEVKEQVLQEANELREKNQKVDQDLLFKEAMKQRGVTWKAPGQVDEKKHLFKKIRERIRTIS